VVTAREHLAGYVTLQRLLERRAALKLERDTPPQALTVLRSRFAERHAALANARSRREALAAEQATLQAEAEMLREEREHFRKQKSQVTNMKQLSAVVSELDHVEIQFKAKEDRLLELWQELEALDKQILEFEQESPEEKELRQQAEQGWQERRKLSEGELHDIESELRVAQRQLGKTAMDRFRKLWSSRKPSAVVAIDGATCSACHAELRPSLVQIVRTAEDLAFCDHCRRLLYDPEQFSAPS
jgi:predicted  nucleic acid-binding Zn-ribbon protein